MSIKASALKKALELVRPGLATKEILEQATSFIFRDGLIYGFNDQIAVMAPFDMGVTGVVSQEILDFASKLKGDAEIEVEEKEHELRFVSGRSKAGVVLNPDIKLPLDEELIEPEAWYPIPEMFLKALQFCLFSASRSGHAPILTCVHITPEYMETCDEFRLTRYALTGMKGDLGENGIKVVAKNIDRLRAYSPKEYGLAENWLHFRNGEGLTYCVRMVEGEYPELDKHMNFDGVDLELPTDLGEALDWASVVADDAIKFEQKVKVNVERGKMTISGQGPAGWAEHSLRIRYTGKPIEFEAHPVFLREMAKIAPKVAIGDSALRINGEGFIHVVALNSEE